MYDQDCDPIIQIRDVEDDLIDGIWQTLQDGALGHDISSRICLQALEHGFESLSNKQFGVFRQYALPRVAFACRLRCGCADPNYGRDPEEGRCRLCLFLKQNEPDQDGLFAT